MVGVFAPPAISDNRMAALGHAIASPARYPIGPQVDRVPALMTFGPDDEVGALTAAIEAEGRS